MVLFSSGILRLSNMCFVIHKPISVPRHHVPRILWPRRQLNHNLRRPPCTPSHSDPNELSHCQTSYVYPTCFHRARPASSRSVPPSHSAPSRHIHTSLSRQSSSRPIPSVQSRPFSRSSCAVLTSCRLPGVLGLPRSEARIRRLSPLLGLVGILTGGDKQLRRKSMSKLATRFQGSF